MKKSYLGLPVCFLFVALAYAGEPTSPDPRVGEAKTIIKEFFSRLKGELQAAMQSGGPVNAVQVCRQRAPAIAAELSESSGWEVGRTSLKLRNPANAPDAWELAVLERFEQRKAGGEDPAGIAHGEVVEEDGEKTFRFMKAIPTAELCVTCHGAALPPDLEATLDRLYPTDRARGFQVGDIRGAFTLSKPL